MKSVIEIEREHLDEEFKRGRISQREYHEAMGELCQADEEGSLYSHGPDIGW